ncbi:hypothetical protein FLSI110296_15670 [Flavobacterium sinopsychrotolerans]|uniref:HEPN domain-containing protein n=1 Tax=Flavobacterium sinopsychrotolerans TaxID=604089 RepID=A0A1H8HIC1_9FLAO|nr:hypothetical protein [Flavobacterium sinopsychrotolerans]SEN55951.1 hypothetical protein SAMN04487942_0211 [Flavobacterium sinopsychrotolerans]
MYHNILTQKEYPNYSQIKKIIKLLLKLIETDTIYFSHHLEEKINLGIITVLVSENNPHSWEDIYEYSSNLFKAYPEFSFRVFNAEWVKESLSDGNIFFIMHCSEQELVYSTDDNNSVLVLKKINAKRLIKKTKKTFFLDFKESGIIGRDRNFHLRCENYLMVAYTMHQELRSLFLGATWFLTGEWLGEHSLEKLQKDLSKFSSTLGKTFDPAKEEEWFVLEQLENASAAIQFNEEIEPISKKTVEEASEKVDWVEKEVQRLFEQCIKKTKQKIKDHGKK